MYSEHDFKIVGSDLYWANGNLAGYRRPNGYIIVTYRKAKHLAHRIVFFLTHGYLPAMIDHVDGNPSNNAPSNLRAATHNINQQNLHKPRGHNTTGFLGVSMRQGKYRARIVTNGIATELGLFTTPEAASAAYQQAKTRLHVQAEDRPCEPTNA